MKIEFRSTRHALTIAKRIKKHLRSIGMRVTDGKSMEVAARVFGYADWHELDTSTKRSSISPSPWDDEVEEAVRLAREQAFITRLSQALDIPTDAAQTIISDIGPTKRSSKRSPGVPEWRKMKKKLEDEDGFVSMTLNATAAEIREGYSSKENLSPHWGDKKHRIEIEHAGETFEILLARSQDLHGYGFAVHEIDAFMFCGAEVVGTFTGSVIKSREPVSGPIFYRGCDDCNQWLADTADLLVDQYPRRQYLGSGKSILLIERWEVKTGTLPKGSGRALIEGVGKILRRTDRKFEALAMVVDPSQFCAVSLNKRVNMPSYIEAALHLRDHFFQSRPQEALGKDVELMLLSMATRAESPHAELLFRHRKHFPKPAPDSIDLDRDTDSIEASVISLLKNQVLDLSDLDETVEGQPLAVPPDELPDGFDIGWAMVVKSFKPSPRLWELMPDDLTEITVNYRSTKFGDVSSVEYRFANGTLLDLPAEYLLFGEKYELYPDALKTGSGWRIRSNPYTSMYGLSDLFSVLKINSAFLFDGNKENEPSIPGHPVTVKRPDTSQA